MKVDTGRARARKQFPILGDCERCGERPARERHHLDGDTFNNDRANVAFLCVRCHQTVDGRIGTRPTGPMIAAAAARRRAVTHCKRGHEFTPENTKVDRRGFRRCRICQNEATRAYRERRRI